MRVLHGQDIGIEVVKLIDRAQKIVILVSAYYDPWLRATTAIENAMLARKLPVIMFLRGGKERDKHFEATAPLRAKGMRVEFLERLHAKFYANESEAILTSMNLVGTSAQDSWEIGTHVTRADADALKQVAEAIQALTTQARQEDERRKALQAAAPLPPITPAVVAGVRAEIRARTATTATGHCIRCSADIALNVEKPFCRTCYAKWAEYENDAYEEKYCHSCGEASKTSKMKPQCRSCFRAGVTA
jgi:hypothetical protein